MKFSKKNRPLMKSLKITVYLENEYPFFMGIKFEMRGLMAA